MIHIVHIVRSNLIIKMLHDIDRTNLMVKMGHDIVPTIPIIKMVQTEDSTIIMRIRAMLQTMIFIRVLRLAKAVHKGMVVKIISTGMVVYLRLKSMSKIGKLND